MFRKRIRYKKLCHELCQNRQRFYKLAYSWCTDSMLADDLVQEAMHKAYLCFDDLKDDGKLQAWTCRIMLNCYRDFLRKQKDTVDIDDLELPASGSPDHLATSQDTVAMVRQCIRKLTEKHRDVITLVDLMDFSYEEVSMALNVPIGTVMSRLCRGRAQLKTLLEAGTRNQQPTEKANLRRVK